MGCLGSFPVSRLFANLANSLRESETSMSASACYRQLTTPGWIASDKPTSGTDPLSARLTYFWVPKLPQSRFRMAMSAS